MIVTRKVALEVASHEALIRQTYKDSKGILTWCVGMTNATGHRVERYIGKPQPLQHCMNLFAWALASYAGQVREMFKGRPLTEAQFAAALSFHWNTGAIKSATWVRYWLRGEDEKARSAFMNWVTPREIATRRGKERDLFFDAKWSNNGSMLEYTHVTSRMTPDWSSGRRINVADELSIAFAAEADVVLDQSPNPDAVPAAPTLTPEEDGAVEPVDEANDLPDQTEEPVVAEPKPELTPIEQMNKPVKGTSAGLGFTNGIGAVIYLAMLADLLPQAWESQEATLALGLVIANIGQFLNGWVGYLAPDLRFQSKKQN